MMTVNKVMLWAVALLAVAFLLFPNYMGFFLNRGNGDVKSNHPLVRTTTFTVEGMTCEGCSALVEKVIRDVPGVLSVKVDYDKKLATVATEECYPVPSDAIIDALQKAGYRAAVVERSSPAGTDTTGSKAGCCEKGCEAPPAADKDKTDAGSIDPNRQIIFTVDGFT
jgi:copper chaperone CopZ